MGHFLFKVQETFQLKDIGLVIAADIKIKDAKVGRGDELEFRLADGSKFITKVAGINIMSPYNPERLFSFSLPKGADKAYIPIGTEVWSHP